MAAGQADGIQIWDIYEQPDSVPTDTFLPTTTDDGKFRFCLDAQFLIM